MTPVTRIYLDLPPKILRPRKDNGYSPGAPHYRARLGGLDGEIIVQHTPTPFFDAARVLLSKRVTGTLEMWDGERSYPRMRGDIAKMAKLTVIETDTVGPTIARHVPFPAHGIGSKTADQG